MARRAVLVLTAALMAACGGGAPANSRIVDDARAYLGEPARRRLLVRRHHRVPRLGIDPRRHHAPVGHGTRQQGGAGHLHRVDVRPGRGPGVRVNGQVDVVLARVLAKSRGPDGPREGRWARGRVQSA